jgi:hypothetical protein
MNIQTLIPSSGLPQTRFYPGQTVSWLGGADNEEDFVRQGGHPLYGRDDITYQFNSHGYRCAEFDTEADIRLISIGCSHTLGQALPQAELFHERFAQRLRSETGKSVVNWNLSQVGSSNDYVTRVLYLTVPKLNPHMVLINFTYSSRREYMTAHNEQVGYIPLWPPHSPTLKEVYQHFEALSSRYDNQLNMFRNYKSVENLLHNHLWLYSLVSPNNMMGLDGHMDLSRYVGSLEIVDHGRDGTHPGPRSNELLFDCYWRRFVELQMLDRFRDGPGPRPGQAEAPASVPSQGH